MLVGTLAYTAVKVGVFAYWVYRANRKNFYGNPLNIKKLETVKLFLCFKNQLHQDFSEL